MKICHVIAVLGLVLVLSLVTLGCLYCLHRNASQPRTNEEIDAFSPSPAAWILLRAAQEEAIGSTTYAILGEQVYWIPPGLTLSGFNSVRDTLTIAEADPASFEIFAPSFLNPSDPSYARDKSHVYCNQDLLQGADPASFGVVAYNQASLPTYARDANHLYDGCFDVRTSDGYTPYFPENAVDAKTFTLISNDNEGLPADYAGVSSYAWFKDKDAIYLYDPDELSGGLRVVSNVDRDTFEVVPNTYGRFGKDNHAVYYLRDQDVVSAYASGIVRATILEGADPESFSAVSTNGGSWYAKDKTHVYYKGIVVESADPVTITFIGADSTLITASQYAKDRWSVFRDGEPVSGTSPQTFSLQEASN